MINIVKIPRAYSKVYSFINTLGMEYIEKIPNKIYNTIKDNRDKEYNPVFKKEQTLKKELLSHEALCLLSALNLQYWCRDAQEKNALKIAYLNNTKKYDEKYSYENIFKNNSKPKIIEQKVEKKLPGENITQNESMIEMRENIFQKIIKKIKSIFRK